MFDFNPNQITSVLTAAIVRCTVVTVDFTHTQHIIKLTDVIQLCIISTQVQLCLVLVDHIHDVFRDRTMQNIAVKLEEACLLFDVQTVCV